MGRIRTVKPEFFRHEELFEAEKAAGLPLRLAFAGLWTCCDREGRFRWKPRQLKLDVLPYDDIDFSRVLDALMTRGFLVRYASETEIYGYIPSWNKHQIVNPREKPSILPAPPPSQDLKEKMINNQPDGRVLDASSTRASLDSEMHVQECGEREGEKEKEREDEKENQNMNFGKRKKKLTPLPDDFVVTEEHRSYAFKNGLPSPDDEIEAFKSHHGAKGSEFKDWNLALYNWLRNAKKFNQPRGTPNGNNFKPSERPKSKTDMVWEGIAPGAFGFDGIEEYKKAVRDKFGN